MRVLDLGGAVVVTEVGIMDTGAATQTTGVTMVEGMARAKATEVDLLSMGLVLLDCRGGTVRGQVQPTRFSPGELLSLKIS